MIEGGIYYWGMPLVRGIAGFMIGIMLGIIGGWIAVAIYALAGFPWDVEIQRNLYMVWIGLGAGLGSYLGWMNLTSRWSIKIAFVLLVLAGGILGAYSGFIYGQRIEASYLGQRYTLDSAIHFGAAIGGIITATGLGLLNQWSKNNQ